MDVATAPQGYDASTAHAPALQHLHAPRTMCNLSVQQAHFIFIDSGN